MARFARSLIFSLASLCVALPAFAAGSSDPIVNGKNRSTSTPLWFEQAYDRYPLLGPSHAKGLLIWNHPIDWTGLGPDVPPAPAIEGMAALGWDVIRLQRNPRLAEEAQWQAQIQPLTDALARQVADARSRGYKRVVIAGQGFGGGIAVESAQTIKDLYGVIAFAPNTGVGRGRSDQGNTTSEITGELVSVNTQWTASRLKAIGPARLFLLFPDKDEQMPGSERGADARRILEGRRDLPFVLVDEDSGVRGNTGADTKRFDPFATCLGYFFEPDRTPPAGEYRCGTDDMPAALARMGVKPKAAGGEPWFGYSSRGQEIYLELLPDNRVVYGWGRGPTGKITPGVKTYEAKADDDAFSFELNDARTVRGTKEDGAVHLVIEQPDHTQVAVDMHPL
jgi:dienelactone hydrolase